MATDLETKAKEAFIDDHFQLAAELYSKAIEISPNNADLYVDRAQANIKLGNFTGIFLFTFFIILFNYFIIQYPSIVEIYKLKFVNCLLTRRGCGGYEQSN